MPHLNRYLNFDWPHQEVNRQMWLVVPMSSNTAINSKGMGG
jgi:hypothetical protein